jgi:hypothetical protein
MDLASIPSAFTLTASLAASIWDFGIFEAETWKKTMYALRIALTFGGAMLLMYELRARKLGERIPMRTRRNVAIVLSVLAFGVYYDFGNPKVRYPEYYHRHEFFHYYLGSKYYEELGYKSIYECTAAAETDLGRGAQVMRRELRDLRVNLIKPVTASDVQQHIQECRQAFAPNPQRWEAFKKDVDWFYESSRGSYWDNMQSITAKPAAGPDRGQVLPSSGLRRFLQTLSASTCCRSKCLCVPGFGRIGACDHFSEANAQTSLTGGAFLRQTGSSAGCAVCLRKRRFVAGAALTYWRYCV